MEYGICGHEGEGQKIEVAIARPVLGFGFWVLGFRLGGNDGMVR